MSEHNHLVGDLDLELKNQSSVNDFLKIVEKQLSENKDLVEGLKNPVSVQDDIITVSLSCWYDQHNNLETIENDLNSFYSHKVKELFDVSGTVEIHFGSSGESLCKDVETVDGRVKLI